MNLEHFRLGTLPAIQFFCPTETFLTWLPRFAKGRTIVDCGAGIGHLGTVLPNVIMLDVFKREGGNPNVLQTDATVFPFHRRSLPIICRPCHGDWVQETIHNAVARTGSALYVGLKRNLSIDLHGLPYHQTTVLENAGEAGELVIMFKPYDPHDGDVTKRRFSLVENYPGEASWWENPGDGKLYNLAGGHHRIGESNIIETVEAPDFEDLDWTKTHLMQPNSDAGWLDPFGVLHGCESRGHDLYAKYILKSGSEALLDSGWARIYGKDGGLLGSDYARHEDLTDAQRSFLLLNGYKSFDLEETPEVAPIQTLAEFPDLNVRKPSRLDREGD